MNNEKIEWIATRTFTNEHIGKALTKDELRERKEWEMEYRDEIWEVSKIVKFSEHFGKLDFEIKMGVASSLIKDLKNTKDINMEIKGALKENLLCINDLDTINKMMEILSRAKDVYGSTIDMIVAITDKNIIPKIPNESALLEKNMATLKESIIDILEKVKEQIKTYYNVSTPDQFTYIDIKDKNKPIKK